MSTKETKHKYYLAHREATLKRNLQWRHDHPTEYRTIRARYRERHRDALREYGLVYRRENAERERVRKREWQAKWRVENPRGELAQRIRKYGLTTEQYDELLVAQGGVCAVCAEPPARGRLHVDHDHGTGRIRGLLCRRCNTGLYLLENEPLRLRALAHIGAQ